MSMSETPCPGYLTLAANVVGAYTDLEEDRSENDAFLERP